MSGNLFEPQFSIVNLDKAGSGEIIRVSFYPGKRKKCNKKRSYIFSCHLSYYDQLLS